MSSVDTATNQFVGKVKWFNNKSGYGFITFINSKDKDKDIFAHHSSLNVKDEIYKYLVQGEYVEFNLAKTTSGAHEWQASSVNGIKGGKLMCETRREFKIARTSYKPSDESQGEPRMPRQQRAPRARGEGPRDGEKKEWTLVNKTDKPARSSRPPRQGATNETK